MSDSAEASSTTTVTCLLMWLWIAVETGLLAAFFWIRNISGDLFSYESLAPAMLLGAASVPAALVMSLVMLLCGPRHRRWRWTWLVVAAFALVAWCGLEQVAIAAHRQLVVPVLFGQLEIAIGPTQLMLVWWLCGVFLVVFVYRYYGRASISRNVLIREDIRLRSSHLLLVMLLGSIAAGGTRLLAGVLSGDGSDVLLSIGYAIGFGVCSGCCFLFLTVGMMQSAWWGYGGVGGALLVTVVCAVGIAMLDPERIAFEWTLVVLLSLVVALVHFAIFLLPLRAAGYRMSALRYERSSSSRGRGGEGGAVIASA